MRHQAPDPAGGWIVVASHAALLSAPDPESPTLIEAPPGTRLTSTGEAVFLGGRLWRQVRHPTGAEGFIRDAFLVPADGET